jgi:hypothetical protein
MGKIHIMTLKVATLALDQAARHHVLCVQSGVAASQITE